MEELGKQILDHILVIRMFVVLCFIAFLVCGAFYIANVISNIRLNRQLYIASKNETNAFGFHADEMLRRNDIEHLINTCDLRIKTHVNDPEAYLFKAKALYYQGKFHEAKRCFEQTLELESSFDYMLEPWLNSIENKIKENAPFIMRAY